MPDPWQSEPSERRIAVGDWVRLTTEGSVRGPGKVVDADYASEDNSLRHARVEFARGTYWFFGGDLVRIQPEEEARICEEALASAVVDDAGAAPLRASLHAFRSGSPFVRSPGLLDKLWVLVPAATPGASVLTGLARFLDEWRAPKPLFVQPPPQVLRRRPQEPEPELHAPAATTPPSTMLPVHEATPAPRPRRQPRPAPLPSPPAPPKPAEVLPRVLATLNHNVLIELARKRRIELPRRESAAEIRRLLLLSRIDLNEVLTTLTPTQVAAAARAIGLDATGEGTVVAERILALAGH